MTGRTNCGECESPVLLVFVAGRRTVLDWPRAEHGGIAVEHTATDSWLARYVPVGEAVRVTEHRYRVHACQPPAQDLSEPQRAAQPLRGEAFRAAAKAAQSQHNAALRNRRGQRPGKPVTGYRVRPQ